ncbi:MAG: hypothetical protein ABW157_20415 [Candidatus Thiodiazotropha sp. LLP2]
MSSSFGEQLIQFAYAVDYIDADNFNRIRQLVDNYTRNTLNITVTRFMVTSQIGDKIGLIPHKFATMGKYSTMPVRDAKNHIASQTAYSFIKNRPLWIVSATPNNPLLNKSVKYRDLWSKSTSIPKYIKPSSDPIKTSIIIPLKDENGVTFGIFNFETTERLDITQAAKQELSIIADAVAITYRTFSTTKARNQFTGNAIDELNKVLQKPLPKLTKPNIFLASSSDAEGDVIKAIKAVFMEKEYLDKFNQIYWKDIHRPGNINMQLLLELGTCRYGVCYLSEAISGEKPTLYQDNPNVVFEAGMLHGRSDADSPIPASWIPIREKNSVEAPFDFATQRMIQVPRNSGKLQITRFKAMFRKRLDALIDAKK